MAKLILTFKSNLPNLTVLKITSQDIEELKSNVRKKIRQAPMMFIGMQVVIDLSDFDKQHELSLNLNDFKNFLRGESINPIAAMSNKIEVQKLAIECGIGALPMLQLTSASAKVHADIDCPEKTENVNVIAPNYIPTEPSLTEERNEEPRKTFEQSDISSESKIATDQQGTDSLALANTSEIIKHSIRSGQSIYAQGDLTIIGSVSPGAEVIADGSIHVYGTLKGRAIAGAQGNINASIFCQKLDAELIAIAGSYTQIEDGGSNYLGQTVQISLENEKICFFPL